MIHHSNGCTTISPCRVARGTKATLDASITDLYEGELCYATDENVCYVVESGALEPASAGAQVIGDLNDVNLAAGLTGGEVLVYDIAESEWVPGAPPAQALDALSDVDTSTTPPTEGQILLYNSTDSEWQPGDLPEGGVTSVNTLTGAVSIGVDDLDDYELPASYTVYNGVSGFTGTTGGIYYAYSSARLAINDESEDGLVLTDANVAQVGQLVELSTDGGVTWGNGVTVTAQSSLPEADGFGYWRFDHDGPVDWPSNVVGVFDTGTDLWLRWSGGAGGLGDGNVLVYNATDAKWNPGGLTVEQLGDVSFENEYEVYDGIRGFNASGDSGINYNQGSATILVNDQNLSGKVYTNADIAGVGDLLQASQDGINWNAGVTVTGAATKPDDGFGWWSYEHDGEVDWPTSDYGAWQNDSSPLYLRWVLVDKSLKDGNSLVYNATNSQWELVRA